MDRYVSLEIRHSIRMRLLLLVLVLTIVPTAIVTYVGVDSIVRSRHNAKEASDVILREQAAEYLGQLTAGEVRQTDLVLQDVEGDVLTAAHYASRVLDHPGSVADGEYWQAQDHMSVGEQGQYVNGAGDVCTVFVPNTVTVDGRLNSMLEAMAYLDFLFPAIYDNDPNAVAIYVGTEQQVTWYYPNVNLGAILPPDFQVTARPWYVNTTKELGNTDGVVWSPVYEDATGQGLMVTAAAPVLADGDELVGVLGIDLALDEISGRIESIHLAGTGYSFLIDDERRAVALSEQGYWDILGEPGPRDDINIGLQEVTPAFAPVIGEMVAGSTGVDTISIEGVELFVAYAPLRSTGWSLGSVVRAEDLLQSLETMDAEMQASTTRLLLARIVPLSVVALVVVVAVAVLFTHRLARPLRELAAAASQIGAGRWNVPLPETTDDEIGVLAKAFAIMVDRVRRSVKELEQRVTERTRHLGAVAEVSRAATSVLDPADLLQQTADLICDRFELYYVGLFLLDAQEQFAVLRAGTGDAGRHMVAQGHRLEVGGQSMIGRCVATGESDVQLDVGETAVRFENPLLPDTHSELALPLRSRGRVIGAMTVQSDREADFDRAYVSVLQTMADQVAIAIDNAQLFADAQAALQEMKAAQKRYLPQEWGDYLAQTQVSTFDTEHPDRDDLERGLWREIQQALLQRRVSPVAGAEGHSALVAPISIRGHIIGALGIHDRDWDRQWTEDDIALVQSVVERMASAADNLRLVEDTQRQEVKERRLREIADRMRSAPDIDSLIKITVEEMASTLNTTDAFLQFHEPTDVSGTSRREQDSVERVPDRAGEDADHDGAR